MFKIHSHGYRTLCVDRRRIFCHNFYVRLPLWVLFPRVGHAECLCIAEVADALAVLLWSIRILLLQRQFKLELLHQALTVPAPLLQRRRWALRYHALVPVPVVLQRVQDVLGVGLHQVSPRLPERMDDVVNESHLRNTGTCMLRGGEWLEADGCLVSSNAVNTWFLQAKYPPQSKFPNQHSLTADTIIWYPKLHLQRWARLTSCPKSNLGWKFNYKQEPPGNSVMELPIPSLAACVILNIPVDILSRPADQHLPCRSQGKPSLWRQNIPLRDASYQLLVQRGILEDHCLYAKHWESLLSLR